MLERRTDWLKRAQFDEVKTQITERLPHLRNGSRATNSIRSCEA